MPWGFVLGGSSFFKWGSGGWLNVGSFHLGLQIRTHSIRKAHENIDRTLKAAEVILAHFDQYRQVGFLVLFDSTSVICFS